MHQCPIGTATSFPDMVFANNTTVNTHTNAPIALKTVMSHPHPMQRCSNLPQNNKGIGQSKTRSIHNNHLPTQINQKKLKLVLDGYDPQMTAFLLRGVAQEFSRVDKTFWFAIIWSYFWRALNQLYSFMNDRQVKRIPCPIHILVDFILHLYNLEYFQTSIRSQLSTIDFIHRLANYTLPSDSLFIEKADDRYEQPNIQTWYPFTDHSEYSIVNDQVTGSMFKKWSFPRFILKSYV